MQFQTIRETTPITVTCSVRRCVSKGDETTPPVYQDVFETRTEYKTVERQVPVSTLAEEVYQDPGQDNCLDFACTLLDELEAKGVDISEYQVVLMENVDPDEPGHVGLLDAEGRFFDASGEHDFAEWSAEHPELRLLTAADGTLPAGDDFLEVMSLPPGEARDAALESAGLSDIANKELAIAPLVVLGLAAVVLLLTGCAASEGPVFNREAELQAAIANGDSLVDATFNFHVEGVDLRNLDLSGAHFTQGLTVNHWDYNLQNTNLQGAVFDGPVTGWFFGADLRGATFNGDISNSNFLYADLRGADFESASSIAGTTFSFSTVDGSTRLPMDCPSCAYTGLPGGSPLLTDGVQLNTPEVLLALTGTDDPARQAEIIRDMAANHELLPALQAVLPPGTLDAALPPSWRSMLYDDVRAAGEDEFTVKSFIFDDVNNAWATAIGYDYNDHRPDGGPTLSWLYNELGDVPLAMPSLQTHIDALLADALLSEQPTTIGAPIGERVSFGNFPYAFPASGSADADSYVAAAERSLTGNWEWNGEDYPRGAIMLPPDVIAYALANLDPVTADAFRAIAADNIVSAQELMDAGLFEPVMRAAYDYYTP